MELLQSLGIVVIDDERTKLRLAGTLSSLSELFALKADQTALSGFATTAQVNAAIAAQIASLVSSSPSTLDTLQELSAALNNDASAFSTLTAAIATNSGKMTKYPN